MLDKEFDKIIWNTAITLRKNMLMIDDENYFVKIDLKFKCKFDKFGVTFMVMNKEMLIFILDKIGNYPVLDCVIDDEEYKAYFINKIKEIIAKRNNLTVEELENCEII